MSELNKLTLLELEVLHESIGLTVEINNGVITGCTYEGGSR